LVPRPGKKDKMSLDEAKKKRAVAKGLLTKTTNLLADMLKAEDPTEDGITTKLKEFQERLDSLDDTQQAVMLLMEEDDLQAELDASESYREQQCDVRMAAQRLLRRLEPLPPTPETPRSNSGGSSSDSIVAMKARLPKLNLPTFKGDVTEFPSFWEQFVAHVDADPTVADVTKFSYLNGYLKGEAKACIRGLALTGANYPTACDLLKKRYGRKERIVFAHLQALLSIPVPPGTGKAEELWSLMDELQCHVHSLEAMGVDGEQYGVVLTPILLSRLPEQIRMEWAREGEGREGDLVWLLDFLRREIERRECSQTFDQRPAAHRNTAEKKTAATPSTASALHVATAADTDVETHRKQQCYLCKGLHCLWHCPKFKDYTVDKRASFIAEAGICSACFSSRHGTGECIRRCRNCQGPHHRLLCTSPCGVPGERRVPWQPPMTAAAAAPIPPPADRPRSESGIDQRECLSGRRYPKEHLPTDRRCVSALP
jgi:hypothetical protein